MAKSERDKESTRARRTALSVSGCGRRSQRGVRAHERTDERQGYRHGTIERTLTTAEGTRTVSVPRGRVLADDDTTAEFHSRLLPRYARRTREVEEAGLELLTFYEFPKATWQSIRTTNLLENLHREFRRQTKTHASFGTEAAALTVLSVMCPVSGAPGHGAASENGRSVDLAKNGLIPPIVFETIGQPSGQTGY